MEFNGKIYYPEVPTIVDIYRKYLPTLDTGSFVEVGAYDGETHSNTAMLADNGWTGLYVEPVPEFAKKCKQRHKNNDVMVVTAAAGEDCGLIAIHVAEQLTSTNHEFSELCNNMPDCEFKAYYDNASKYGASALELPLDFILLLANYDYDFDVLVLDTEHTEDKILYRFPLAYWVPKIIVIEMHEQSEAWQQHKFVQDKCSFINKLMSDTGYDKVYTDDTNTVFVRGDIYENINNG